MVLLNLKNLLMSFRWSKELPVNYLQWLITVVNDCVYYFLKHSEPIYAFHALTIAQFYFKKVFLRPGEPFSLSAAEGKVKGKIIRTESARNLKAEFASYASRLVDPTYEIYAER